MRQPSGVRGTLLAFALAGTVLLAAACGGGGNPAAGGSDAYQKALGYAQCMRSHGEPDWPDPTSTGTFSISGIDLDSPQFSAASSACQSLAPGGMTFQLSAAQQQALLDAALKFSACMRAHGITNFPGPQPERHQHIRRQHRHQPVAGWQRHHPGRCAVAVLPVRE